MGCSEASNQTFCSGQITLIYKKIFSVWGKDVDRCFLLIWMCWIQIFKQFCSITSSFLAFIYPFLVYWIYIYMGRIILDLSRHNGDRGMILTRKWPRMHFQHFGTKMIFLCCPCREILEKFIFMGSNVKFYRAKFSTPSVSRKPEPISNFAYRFRDQRPRVGQNC